ncbi:MAG: NosD domain-containing protein [Rhodothermales bacterium]
MKKTVLSGLGIMLHLLMLALPSTAQLSETLVLSGETAPGTNLTFESFTQALSDEEGLVVFQGILSDGTRGIWYYDDGSVFEVIREGQALPGAPDEFISSDAFFIIGVDEGSFAFRASTFNGGAMMVGNRTGLSTVAYGGMPAPGTSDLRFSSFDNSSFNGFWSYSFNNNVLAFTALARDTTGFKAQNGIWQSSGGGAPTSVVLSESDQFDEVDEWPEVPGVVFEFRDIHVSDSGEIIFRANASPPVAQYLFKSSGNGRTLVDLGNGFNLSLIRVAKDGRVAVVASNETETAVLIESAAGSGAFERVMTAGDIPTDQNGNQLDVEPWKFFASAGMGFDESGQLFIHANVDTPTPTSGIWVRRLDGSVEMILEGGFLPDAQLKDANGLGINAAGDLALGFDRDLWFLPVGGELSRVAGPDDVIAVAPGDERIMDLLVLATTYFSSPGYGGRNSVLREEQSVVALSRFADDSFAILKLSGLAGGLVVNATSDEDDLNPGDGVCNTGGTVNGDAACTLRAAIQEANTTAEQDNIIFSISGDAPYFITVESPLPAITNPVNLAGPAYEDLPLITLDGVGAGDGAAGLTLEGGAAGSSIKNLWILAFQGPGIWVQSNEVSISSCMLGLDGSQLTGNATGLTIVGHQNTVAASFISGNNTDGIHLTGDDNVLQNNIIGLDKTGTEDVGNGGQGIWLSGSQNLVENNVISRNAGNGILVAAGDGNEFYKNFIGTDGSGRNRLGNVINGILVEGATNSVIGNTGEGNVLSGNLDNGVSLKAPSSGSLVLANYIGVDVEGEVGSFNVNAGVFIDGASDNLIGSVSPETGNLIRDNQFGVVIRGDGIGNTIRYNVLKENRILDIDLNEDEKITANDLHPTGIGTDDDDGPNSLMNFPVGILRTIDENGDILVSGFLDTRDPAGATIDLYGVENVHESGVGGGDEWLGSLSPDSSGQFVFVINPSVSYKLFSATATDEDGSTSEFSPVCTDPDGDGNPDSDGDALCDMWEIDGLDYDMDGLIDLQFSGTTAANPRKKDIYVEVDWMETSGNGMHSHEPLQSSLDQVVAAFAKSPVQNPDGSKGVRLHFLKDGHMPEVTPVRMHTGSVEVAPAGTFDDLKYGKQGTPCGGGEGGGNFGTMEDRASERCPAILGARRLTTRYLIFGHDHAHSPGSSGVAELPGNDFMVTIGSWGRAGILATGGQTEGTTAAFVKAKASVEAGTIMHEMGHTLNLKHGGVDHNNCKPNYISVMNYALQFPYMIPNRPLNYSSKALPELDEARLNENNGLSGKMEEYLLFNTSGTAGMKGQILRYTRGNASSIDWNDDNAFMEMQAADIDYIPDAGCEWQPALKKLKSHDDWSNLVYNFRATNGFGDGSQRSEPASIEAENAPEITMEAAMNFDFDGDGLVNALDNCAVIANEDQADLDQDGIGDVCEMGQADLSIVAENRNRTADESASEQLQFFKLTIYNAGPDSALAVTLSDTLFAEANLQSITASKGGCVASSSVLVCTSEVLAPGDSMTVSYEAVLQHQTQVNRWATVSGDAQDADISNNQIMGTVSVANEGDQVVDSFTLFQNFPNPFNRHTSISFELPAAQHVRLAVYDMLGREVLRAVDAFRPAGRHEVVIPASNFASGVYIYKFETESYTDMKQMIVVK